MVYKVADFLVERLHDWGITRVFGYPGDGINPILGALDRAQGVIDFIQARHEANAAFMACAHAKFTGEPGVCMATAGPGAIQLLNGLYDAKMDNQPVIALVGQQQRTALGTGFLQDVDLKSLFKDVASDYVQLATVPEQVRHLIDRAIRIAKSERTVTCVIIPSDVQDMKAEPHPPRKHGMTFSGTGYAAPHIVPYEADLREAAQLLNNGEKVAILVGAGALGATDEVIETADRLGAGLAKALLGKAVVPDDLPWVTGSIGMLGTEASWKLMESCDTFFMIGSNFPYSEFLPKEGTVKGVQIDIESKNLSLRYPMDVALHGDTKQTLRALLPMLQHKSDRSWRTEVESSVIDWWKTVEARAQEHAEPINPQLVFSRLSEKLPDRAILSADSGTATVWYARNIRMRRGMAGSASGGLASMGCAVPYATAAKFAHPERVVVALVGDGAMQMSGMGELLTVAKYAGRWIDPRYVVIVLNNHDLNFVTWEMRVQEGNPKFEASQDLPRMNYAEFANSIGLRGIRLEWPDQIDAALDAAFTADRPVIIDVLADPNIPPLPPRITPEQTINFTEAMIKGDSNTPKPFIHSLGQILKGFFPG